VPRGAKRATLDDWETGGTLEVELDPALAAKAQAETFFRRARKLARGEALMRERLADTERALERARGLAEEIAAEAEVSIEAIEAWSERAREIGVRVAGAPPGKKKPREAPRLPYLEYRRFHDRPIHVGRGPVDNDRLTTEIARPHDVWMHARGVPGAHVIVPLTKGESCPPELLVDAATLAAHHSDARGEDTVEVTWAERRYVRKPRGFPPGKVVVDREKVLTLRVQKKRLDELLKSRGG
jgi:predicted ribosome quality control (RQC) complex YloA/Tae2 family protein